jgi:hypothetical protein
MAPRRVQPTTSKLIEEVLTENEEELDIPASQSSGSEDNYQCDSRISCIIALALICPVNRAFRRLEMALAEKYAGMMRLMNAIHVIDPLNSKEESEATELPEGDL